MASNILHIPSDYNVILRQSTLTSALEDPASTDDIKKIIEDVMSSLADGPGWHGRSRRNAEGSFEWDFENDGRLFRLFLETNDPESTGLYDFGHRISYASNYSSNGIWSESYVKTRDYDCIETVISKVLRLFSVYATVWYGLDEKTFSYEDTMRPAAFYEYMDSYAWILYWTVAAYQSRYADVFNMHTMYSYDADTCSFKMQEDTVDDSTGTMPALMFRRSASNAGRFEVVKISGSNDNVEPLETVLEIDPSGFLGDPYSSFSSILRVLDADRMHEPEEFLGVTSRTQDLIW